MANDKAKGIDSGAVKVVAWNPAEKSEGDEAVQQATRPPMPPQMPPGMMPPGMMPPGVAGGMPPWMQGFPMGESGASPVNEPPPHLKRAQEKQNNFMNEVVAASNQALHELQSGISGRVADSGFFQAPDPGLLERLTKGGG